MLTARPEYAVPWARPPHMTELALNHLSRRDCAQLVQVVAADHGLAASTVEPETAGSSGDNLRADLGTLIRRYGKAVALDLERCAKDAFTFSRTLIETEQIQCNLQDLGRLTCAYRPAHYEAMAREAELVEKVLGQPARMLTRLGAEARDRYRSVLRRAAS